MKQIKLFIILIIGLLMFSSCAGPTFKYSVDVTYQYENEPDCQYVLNFTDTYSYNSSVKDIKISYVGSVGYVNRLVVIPTVHFNDGHHHTYSEKELMFVPDRKFRVVDIKVKGGKIE